MSESDDQMDASGEMITYAAANMPGKPLQIIAISVEKLIMEDSPTSRFSLGRFATQAMEPVRDVPQARPDPKRILRPMFRQQRYQSKTGLISSTEGEPPIEQAPPKTPFDRIYTSAASDVQTAPADDLPWSSPDARVDDTPLYQDRKVKRDMTSPFDDLSTDDQNALRATLTMNQRPATDDDRYDEDYRP